MSKEKTITTLGIIGTCISVAMYFSLIEIAISNLSGTSHIFIQPLITIINCTIWVAYAYLKKERFVFLANLPGVFFGIFTVITAFIK